MGKAQVNLQDSFLNQIRKENEEVKFVFVDGSALIGAVRGFDNFTVVVQGRGAQHLVYKHAVAHIVYRRTRRDDAKDGIMGDQAVAGGADAAPSDSPTPTPPAKPAEEPKKSSSAFNPINIAGLNAQKPS